MFEMVHDLVYIVGAMVICTSVVLPIAIAMLKRSVAKQRAIDDYYEKIIPGYERMTIKK